ncbi:hypothetical protein QVD17_05867 [Tagetes erecta]|uniref:Dynamin GTPase domain-containing protein n=1 Tax=Tagetes erecta TaxID=13708 RepID=A0AAD8PBT4_TARER|nr:hypothetical protein QVD17_05867 [Tagetes erecta]
MLHSEHKKIPPLVKEMSSEKLKEALKTITLLQTMEVLDRKPDFPIIVVLGEAGSCSWSVISTLIGFNLPSGLGIPILLKFRTDSVSSRKIWLKFHSECTYVEKQVSEALFASEIEELVKPIPENKRSKIEFILTVFQPQVSDLTLLVLPEINTRYPGPSPTQFTSIEDMNKEKKEMELFKGYINRDTALSCCFYLNVLPCPSNFNSYMSRKILQEFDCFGTKTVTVFTKLDVSSEYMIKHLTCKNISKAPFGYFFVDNTIEDGENTKVCDMLLSEVDRDYIGFDVISKNLVIAMLSILFHPFSLIHESIVSDLRKSTAEIKESQNTFDSLSDAVPMILDIMISANICLHGLFIAQIYGEYEKVECMHTASNIGRRFKRFRIDLQNLKLDNKFLQYEIELLPHTTRLYLPVFDTSSRIKPLLSRQFSHASFTINRFVTDIVGYIYSVVMKVLLDRAENTLQLHESLEKVGTALAKGVEKSFRKKTMEMLDLEEKCIYTCSDDFNRRVDEMKSLKLKLEIGKEFINIDGLGKNIRVDHLNCYTADQIERAFEMKKTAIAYWEFVVNRFVDYCALYFRSLIKEMVDAGIPGIIKEHLMECVNNKSKLPDVEAIMDGNKVKLERRIEYLIKAKKDIKKWQV